MTISDLVSYIEYIKLDDSGSETLFASIDKLIVADGKIFIFEFRGKNRVLVFDTGGNFLHAIGKIGRGPGEYVMLRNFAVADDKVLLLNRQSQQMIYYDTSGNYIEAKQMPFRASDLVMLEDGNLLFALTKGDLDNKKVVLTDKDFNILSTKLTYSDKELDDFMWVSYFKQTGRNIAFAHPINDTVYVFDSGGSLDCQIYVDFADDRVPDNLRDSYMSVMQNGKYGYINSTPVVSDDYIIGTFILKKRKWTFAFDRQTNRIGIEPFGDPRHYYAKSINIPLAGYGKEIITYINYDIVDDEALKYNGFPQDICEFIKAGGHVICIEKIG